MELVGEERIAASRDIVWLALNDPAVLKQCIPGCETLEYTAPGELAAVVKLKIGPLSTRFHGVITLSDLIPQESYRMTAEGKGGLAGFARGTADVTLSDEEDGTLLTYKVNADVGGKLAKLGARFVDMSAQRMAAHFFADFNAAMMAKFGAA